MHFKTSISFDGLTGAAVQDILRATITGGLESQNFMNNLYEGGLTARAVLQYTGDLDEKMKKKLIKTLEGYANGVTNAGKFIPIPVGMKLEPLSIKLTDSQFFELKKYSALQIAGAFGIKPNQINDYEKSSYSNSEMQNITFYIDTALYILKQYEEELNYKLLEPSEQAEGKHYKFNENVILRTDAKSQAEILTQYVQNGIYTPNEARSFMNKASMDGGDDLICNGNYIKVADIGKEEGENAEDFTVIKPGQPR
jgi:HK97 family phage portal protein